jgi:glutaredoxin-related protein
MWYEKKDLLPDDLLLAWQALFDAHAKNGIPKPAKVIWETMPSLYKDKEYIHGDSRIQFIEEKAKSEKE